MAKCPFAIWTPITGGSGRYTSGLFKIVHHTTEGSTASGAMATFKKHRSDPHFTVDDKKIYQHVDTGVGARALRNESGGVQTNRDSAIQIEVVGFAAKAKDAATLANVARLCRWIEKEHGVPQVWPNGFPKTATSHGRDPGGHNRDARNWDTKGGHYGHCHVPENSHWDPGYTTAELKVIMDNILSTGAPAVASALAPMPEPVEVAVGTLAATGMVLSNRFVQVRLNASGQGSTPIEVAWERVLSVMPFCDGTQSPAGWGQLALGEREGESVVMVYGGRPDATVQVLLKTVEEPIDEDEPLPHCPEGGDEDDDALRFAESGPKGFASGLPTDDADEDRPPRKDMLVVADPNLDDIDTSDDAELNSPTPAPEILALDELLDVREDLRSQPVAAAAAASAAGASVYWPRNDVNSPDYHHLDRLSAPGAFELLGKDIETLIKANRFEPAGADNIIALAFRGCQLKGGEDDEQVKKTRIQLVDVRPDHVGFRCVLGFYYMDTARLTLFTGSTVPAVYYMEEYYKNMHGLPHSYSGGANLLPTGCYVFRVARHSSISPALRMSEPDNLSQDAEVTVLRTTNDLAFGTADTWDRSTPYDNVHCSYILNYSASFKACFSSAGCLTVRGRKTPSHQWEKFQGVLNQIGQGKRCDLLLLTGKECAVAADLRQQGRTDIPPELVRLRAGSQGPEVTELQRKLGLSGTGYFGPSTKGRLTEHQRRMGIPADGVYSAELDRQLGWNVLS